MFLKLFALFIILPLVELALLMKLGAIFGVLHTISLVIITGVIGALLVRQQGFRVIAEFQNSLLEGRAPTDSIIEGPMILIAAAFLLTPGIITDTLGFILVIPYTRGIIRDYLKQYFAAKVAEGAYTGMKKGWAFYSSSTKASGHKINIDKDKNDIIDV